MRRTAEQDFEDQMLLNNGIDITPRGAAKRAPTMDVAPLVRKAKEEESNTIVADHPSPEPSERACKAMLKHLEDCANGMIGGKLQPIGMLLFELEEKVNIEAFGAFAPQARKIRDDAIAKYNALLNPASASPVRSKAGKSKKKANAARNGEPSSSPSNSGKAVSLALPGEVKEDRAGSPPAAAPSPTDLEEFDGMVAPGVSELATIEQQVNKAIELSRTIEQLEETVKQFSQQLHLILTKSLPDAMAAANTEEFKTRDGLKVTIKPFLNGTLPKDPYKRKHAMAFIIDNGGESLIKRQISTTFAKGEHKASEKLVAQLIKMKIAYDDKEDVHNQTYLSFMRELMANGKMVPLEELGLHAGRAAKITPPKVKRG